MISSTALDLAAHRSAAEQACIKAGVFPIGMEALPVRDATGLAVSLEMVDNADIYLGIYAWRYGWVPEGEGCSVTELEFNHAAARQAGGHLREILIFTAHDDHPIKAKDVEANETAQAKLHQFKTRACTGRVRAEFKSPEELHSQVLHSLHELKRRLESAPPSPRDEAAAARLAPRLERRHQLPPAPANFTGREEEERELLAALTGGAAAGATIAGASTAHGWQGMGGVGKTALALVIAHRLKDRYPAAQIYRDLRGADPEQRTPLTPAEVMRDVILALQPTAGQLPDDAESLAPLYRSVLAAAGRVLLLLDNAADAAQVKPLLPPDGCLLLVTSRQRFKLPGLAVRDLHCLSPEKAAALLLELASRIEGYAAEAAQRCGGLPLALEVFAGAVNDKSIAPVPTLLARLQAGEERLGPVDNAFAVSESLLPEETRAAWRLLAIFSASFDLPAAAAVWEKEPALAEQLLQPLVNASLIEHDPAKARFRLHDLARQYCQPRLDAGAEEQARLRHAAHYNAVGEEADRLYLRGGEHVVEGLALFDRERAHLEAVFGWLTTRTDLPSAKLLVSLVNAIAYVGQALRFHPRERIEWLEAQRAAAQRAGDRRGESYALGNIGSAYRDLGDTRKAIELHEKALFIDREIGDRRGEGQDLGSLGLAYRNLGDARKAIEFYEQSVAIAREISDRRGEGLGLGNLGNAYKDLGDARKAIELYEQRLVVAQEIGDRRGEGAVLGNLGSAYAALGDPRKAIELQEQQLVIMREIGDRRGEGTACFNLALKLWPQGERTRALELMATAWKIFTAIEDTRAERAGELLEQWRAEGEV